MSMKNADASTASAFLVSACICDPRELKKKIVYYTSPKDKDTIGVVVVSVSIFF